MPGGTDLVLRPEILPQTTEDFLTDQFYGWECRGRGWQVWDYPTALEPPFQPFFHALPRQVSIVDDGRRHTLVSGLVELVRGLFTLGRRSNRSLPAIPDYREPIAPEEDTRGPRLVEFAVTLPPKESVSKEGAEQLLVRLCASQHPVSFEVLGTPESIAVGFACSEADSLQVENQLQAYFPEGVIEEQQDFLQQPWDRAGSSTVIVDFGLSEEFMRPLNTLRNFDVDPLIGIAGAMSDVRDGEMALFQVIFQAVRHPWAESVMRAVSLGGNESFFADAPDMLALAKEKIARPLCAVVVRAAAKSPDERRAWRLVRAIGSTFDQLANPVSNQLIALANNDRTFVEHEQDILGRQTHRSGMLLNTEELVALVHPPNASVRSKKLRREAKKTKAAPAAALGHELVLGENTHAGKKVSVTLNAEHRSRHTYVIGASGTGKSTLLLNMIVQDMRNGQGVGVLDPHGDLIDQILGYVPADRVKDVVLLDPSDAEFPVGFNILSAHSELEKNLLASDLAAVFRRLSTSWGDQMTAVLGNAVLAMLESDRGGTLIDLRRFLAEKDFRQEYLRSVNDPETVYYFEKEFSLLRGNPQASILTRLNTFLRPKPIRLMVAQKENRLDFAQIMNDGKIFLAKLAQGLIGEENSYLLGALLVTKFHQLAMGRQELAAQARRNFWLYIDEFHHFVTPSLASLLSGARKYRLGLILAHQELQQLWDQDTAVASAVITNPATRICFRVGDFDAKKLAEGFSHFDQKDLQSLGTGEAVCRIERAEYDFNLKTAPAPAVDSAVAEARHKELVVLSRERYGRKREEVEAILAAARPGAESARLDESVEERRPTPKLSVPEPIRERPVEKPSEIPEATSEPSVSSRPKLKALSPLPTLGRGGAQHKYLQHLVKRLAEDRGYRAVIEQPILDGIGSIDVAIEKGDQKIACEISVTTDSEHELGNIQKCLAAGYEAVVVLAADGKALKKLQLAAQAALPPETIRHIAFLQSAEFVTYLDEITATEASEEQTVRGYRVKVRRRALTPTDTEARKQAISKVLLKGMKRLKGDRQQ